MASFQNFYTAKEKLFLGILFFAALISLFFFLFFRTAAFPEHNIQFDITREEAAQKAEEFVSAQEFNPEEFKETTVFSIDDATKTYLEREVGVGETARLAENDVAVWQYTSRFFKPLEQQEITVAYLPNGRLSGYFLEIEEDAKGKVLTKNEAQSRAEDFLRQTIKANLSEWKLVSAESTERSNRMDHAFVWEKIGFKAQDATYRMEVNVFGEKVGGYIEYLKIPESWVRAYEKETSNNDLAQAAAEAVMLLVFGLAILFTFIIEYRRNNLRLASLRIIGLITAVIAILTAFNSIPLTLSQYPTTISWEGFIGSVVLLSLLGGFFEGVSVLLVIAAGEAKFRQMFPKNLSVESLYTTALRTKSVNKALLVGTFCGVIFFTYELVYYFLGKQLGFWAPADINYADLYSTFLPWVYPLFVGFLAAASEEGIFRLFGIPFLKKYVKSTWVAIIITSIVWAFLHSNYPQSPWFVRGIEITVIGVVLGWLFVRFGILASFTAHYTFNALQTTISFYESGSWYASVSSTIVSLIPFIVGIVLLGIAYKHKGFAAEQKEDINENIKAERLVEKKVKTEEKSIQFRPFTRKRTAILLGLTATSLLLIWALYPQTSLIQTPTSLGRTDIKKTADEALAKRSVQTEDFQHVTTFAPEDITLEQEYILEVANFKTLKEVYPERLPVALWTVRYYKPLEKEEFVVDVLPDGRIYQIVHEQDEKAPGANLTEAQAREVAEAYLKNEKKYNLANYKLIEKKAEKKEKRTDHSFVYEEKNKKIGKAVFQTEVHVMGSEVSGYSTYLKLPEAWIRTKVETTTLDFVAGGLIALFGILVVGLGFNTFFQLLREKKLNFRRAYISAAVITVFSILAITNSLSTFFSNYDTAIPLASYTTQSVVSVILGLIFSFFIYALVFGMFFAVWQLYAGQLIPSDTKDRISYVKDAIIAGYSIPLILTCISSLVVYLLITNDLLTSVATFDTFPQLDTYVPAISVITELPMAIGGVSFLAVCQLLLKKYFKSWKLVLALLTFVAILLAIPQQQTAEDITVSIVQNLIILYGGVLLVTLVLRRNILAYMLMIYTSLLFASGVVLFEQTNMFFKINGIILLLFSLLPLLLLSANIKKLLSKFSSKLSR